MAADEQTTWGDVCKKVGFSDNLYQTCRDKVPGYAGAPNNAFDDVGDDEDGVDFNKALAKSAKPVPPPPAADWKHEPEGFFEALQSNKMLMYGGGAAALLTLFLLWKRFSAPVKQ